MSYKPKAPSGAARSARGWLYGVQSRWGPVNFSSRRLRRSGDTISQAFHRALRDWASCSLFTSLSGLRALSDWMIATSSQTPSFLAKWEGPYNMREGNGLNVVHVWRHDTHCILTNSSGSPDIWRAPTAPSLPATSSCDVMRKTLPLRN